jgi:cytochrome c oxidase assembly factor CtaG
VTGGPYAFHPHPVTWAILAVCITLVLVGHRRLQHTDDPPIAWSRKQKVTLAGAGVAAVVALTWPLSDLAAHWSLTALVTQRVIVVLVVAPLLLLGLPYDVIRWLTRPPAVDAVLVRLQRPPLAIITVTAVLIGSMTPAMVRAESSSVLARGLLVVAVLGAGLVLWMPVLGRIPGIPRLKPVVRFGYLVAQAVVPAFLSFIFIFSRHPLYAEFARSHAAIGLRPLNDQQVAGFVSKLSMLFVLLIVGAVVLARAPRSDEEFPVNEPLVWADVERQFERADRRGLSGPVEQFPPSSSPSDRDLSDQGRGGPEPPEGDRPEP